MAPRLSHVAVLLASAIVATQARDSAPQAWDPVHAEFSLPLDVNVVLLGLHGDGEHSVVVDSAELQTLLKQTLPSRQPAFLDSQSRLHVKYEISYSAEHLPSTQVQAYEALIRSSAVFVRVQPPPPGPQGFAPEAGELGHPEALPTLVYEVDVANVEAKIDRILVKQFEFLELSSPGQTDVIPQSVVFTNPRKEKIRPGDVESRSAAFWKTLNQTGPTLAWSYRYRYGETSTASQSWVAKRRYVVVDLSAGPVSFGLLHDVHDHSVNYFGGDLVLAGKQVSKRTYPDLRPRDHAARQGSEDARASAKAELFEFMAEIRDVVTSATKSIFAPDLAFTTADFAEHITLPVIAFRDHTLFDPLMLVGPAAFGAIDMAHVRASLEAAMFPGQQKLAIVQRTHALHDHAHVAVAVQAAIRTDTHHAVDAAGVPHATTKTYIDSKELIYRLSKVDELLVGGLIDLGSIPDAQRAGLDRADGRFDAPGTDGKGQPSGGGRAQGKRILPVFILSLEHRGSTQLLFEGDERVAVSPSCVVVIQSSSDELTLPATEDGHPIVVEGHDVTKDVLAGVLSALGSLSSPTTRWLNWQGAERTDLVWATGCHPYGPFTQSGTPCVSNLLQDTVRRNAVALRLHGAWSDLQTAYQVLDGFTAAFTSDPSLNDTDSAAAAAAVDGAEASSEAAWKPHELVQPTIDRLKKSLELQAQFRTVGGLVKARRYDGAWLEAGRLTASCRAIRGHVEHEVAVVAQRVRSDLSCKDFSQWELATASLTSWQLQATQGAAVVAGTLYVLVVGFVLLKKTPLGVMLAHWSRKVTKARHRGLRYSSKPGESAYAGGPAAGMGGMAPQQAGGSAFGAFRGQQQHRPPPAGGRFGYSAGPMGAAPSRAAVRQLSDFV